MRPRMRFLAMHPEDLRARLLDDLALLPYRRGIDPVLGVEDAPGAFRLRRAHPRDRGERRVVHGLRVARVERASERLFDDRVLAGAQRRHGDRLVRGRRRADMHNVASGDQRVQAVMRGDVVRRGEAPGIRRRRRIHADSIDIDAMNPRHRVDVEFRRETRADDPGANGLPGSHGTILRWSRRRVDCGASPATANRGNHVRDICSPASVAVAGQPPVPDRVRPRNVSAASPAILIMAMDAPSWERRRLAGIYGVARFARMPARRRRSQGRPEPVRRIALRQNENCWEITSER